jgi:serine acetyltransferase
VGFFLKIKRQENFYYAQLYRVGKWVLGINLPVINIIHRPLYSFDRLLRNCSRYLYHLFWSVPLFKSRCELVGKNLCLPNGIPLVIGSHLRLLVGNNVTIGRSTIGSSKIGVNPVLRIGDNSSIGYGTTINIAGEVNIGVGCLISFNCLIMDNDGHPVSHSERLRNMPVEQSAIRPVKIGDGVWIGAHSAVLKGVTIGDNAVIGAHSVVTRDVPPNCICVGNPARILKEGI